MSSGVQKRKNADTSSQMEQGLSTEKKGLKPNDSLSSRPRRRRRRERPVPKEWIFSFGLMMVGVLIAGYILMSHHEKKQLNRLQENILHEKLEPMSQEWEGKYAKLEEDNEVLKKKLADSAQYNESKIQLEEHVHQVESIREKQESDIQHLVEYKRRMQRNLQLLAKTELLEKFGPGPHHVEINLRFDPDFPKVDTDGETGRILIEMAPVEDMPYSVYWFLEQVNRTLYDGCSFHRNAGHVIQGGPAPNFLSPPKPKLNRRFLEAGFHSVMFQEYSPKFPHKKYTLGYAGRPGGPDFYISTMDNTFLHGPGGQTDYEDPTEADPCFAKIIEGFDVADRMLLSPVKPGNYRAMLRNVAITSMKILSENTSKSEDQEVKSEANKEEKIQKSMWESPKQSRLNERSRKRKIVRRKT